MKVRGALLGVFGVATLLVGACIGALVAPGAAPASLTARPAISDVEVGVRPFEDPQPVRVSLEAGTDLELRTGLPGTATALSCEVGMSIRSGSVPFRIDDRPVLALATDVPLWRNLDVGAEGPDVSAVQRELVRLGAEVVVDGVLGAASLRALDRLRRGEPGQPSELRLAEMLWLPAQEVAVTGCTGHLGDRLSAGAPVFTIRPPFPSVHLGDVPALVIEGDRRLEVAGVSVAVDASGHLATPADALRVAEAIGRRANDEAGAEPGVAGVLLLASPLEVGVVPPAAVYDIRDGTACLSGDEGPAEVRLVASQLGEAFVLPKSGERLPNQVAIVPEAAAPCR